MTITSPHNERLKEIRKLARRRTRELAGRFVAEGEDLLAAADAAGWVAVERYCAVGSGLPGVEVSPDALAAVSQLGSGTRALAVYEQHWTDAPVGPLCVYLHGIADPGNVGTILRSALAFGAASVALGPDCADPYGPKAVRASMGAVFAVPLARIESGTAAAAPAHTTIGRVAREPDDFSALARKSRRSPRQDPPAAALVSRLPGTTIALDSHAGEPLAAVAAQLDGPATILVGAERAGLPDELLAAADRVARIPIEAESLNAAMAATVALYELTRDPQSAPAVDHRISKP
jgi:RNA methyltransferase, TrmH family